MNQFLRIKRLVEAQEQLNEATNLILAAISGLSIEDQAQKAIVNPLLRIVDPSRNLDPMNIQDVLAFILTGEEKLYLLIDDSNQSTEEKILGGFKTQEEAEDFINEYSANEIWKIVEIKMK